MKKLSILLSTVAIVLALSIQSCGGGAAGNSPGATVKKSYSLLADKKYEQLVAMYVRDDGTALSEEEQGKMLGLLSMAVSQMEKKEGVKGVEILEEIISEDGTVAEVKYKTTYGNGETDTDQSSKLIKVDGNWFFILGN